MVLRRYVELHPYARGGLRLAVEGRPAAPVIEASAALLDTGAVRTISAHLSSPATSEKIKAEHLQSGRLKLLPLQHSSEAIPAPPHIHISLAAQPREQELPSLPEELVSAGALEVHFWLGEAGQLCRAVSVEGVLGAQRVAELLAGESGRAVFTETVSRTALAELFPGDPAQSVSWRVALGSALSGGPRRRELALTRERIESVEIAILTADERPLSRSLEKFFRSLGILDVRPSRLRQITKRLTAKSRDGLLSLRARTERLIAARILDISHRDVVGSSSIFAQPRDDLFESLLGEEESSNPCGCFGVTLAPSGEDGLKVAVGYAAMTDALEVDAGGARVKGPLWDQQ
jgi:hypothetical protein